MQFPLKQNADVYVHVSSEEDTHRETEYPVTKQFFSH
jgi:hypothetical protein